MTRTIRAADIGAVTGFTAGHGSGAYKKRETPFSSPRRPRMNAAERDHPALIMATAP